MKILTVNGNSSACLQGSIIGFRTFSKHPKMSIVDISENLSLCDLKELCRTCLMKLEKSNNCKDSAERCFVINDHPDVEHIMRVCLSHNSSEQDDSESNSLDVLIHKLCRLCYEKWKDFSKHYKLATENDMVLRRLVEKVKYSAGKRRNESTTNELYLDTEKAKDWTEIEKYDSTLPFYCTSQVNTSTCVDVIQCNNNALNCTAQCEKDESNPPSSPSSLNSLNEKESGDEYTDMPSKCKKRGTKSNACPSFRFKNCKAKRKRKKTPQEPEDEDPIPLKTSSKKAHYRCVPCKKYFYEIRKYEAHVKAVHEGAKKPFQCKLCDKAYKFHKTLIDHIALNHSDKPLETYKCEICNNLFKTQITLRTHVQNKHAESETESRRVICDQCGFLAVNQISLKKHIKNRHTKAEELKCDDCPKVFKNQYYLKYHKMNFHNPLNIKPFQCDECDMAFTRQSLLNIHKRSHLDITQRIKCDFEGCDVRFLQQAEKRRHMRLVHLKVKQYVCDLCGAAFGTKPTLRHHRYIHTNEKPYKCNFCGQGFRQRSAMKTHSKIHAGKVGATEKIGKSSTTARAGVNEDLESSATQSSGR